MEAFSRKIPAASAGKSARISGRCGRRLIAVVDCSHALQEKKDEEQANEVKDRKKTGEASEEGGQQQTIKQEDIVESKYGAQEQNPSAPSATVGVFLGQRRRSFLSAIGRLGRLVSLRAGGFGKRR